MAGDREDLKVVSSVVKEDVRKFYKFIKDLGQGSFGAVRLAHRNGIPEKHYAIKSMDRKIVEEDIELLE